MCNVLFFSLGYDEVTYNLGQRKRQIEKNELYTTSPHQSPTVLKKAAGKQIRQL